MGHPREWLGRRRIAYRAMRTTPRAPDGGGHASRKGDIPRPGSSVISPPTRSVPRPCSANRRKCAARTGETGNVSSARPREAEIKRLEAEARLQQEMAANSERERARAEEDKQRALASARTSRRGMRMEGRSQGSSRGCIAITSKLRWWKFARVASRWVTFRERVTQMKSRLERVEFQKPFAIGKR